MSTEIAEEIPHENGFPELSALGKRIELLRIERGLSKQRLAREADTSRQQLWRVMTGKSELTASLCQRLADVLQVDARALRDGVLREAFSGVSASGARAPVAEPARVAEQAPDFARYAAAVPPLERTLATLPAGDAGRRLKREFLNCVEEVAREEGLRLPNAFFELRGRVINGEA
ncbi:MAG: helix-turn-helix domain-containing protein [Gemmatimonadaceae bacterium]